MEPELDTETRVEALTWDMGPPVRLARVEWTCGCVVETDYPPDSSVGTARLVKTCVRHA